MSFIKPLVIALGAIVLLVIQSVWLAVMIELYTGTVVNTLLCVLAVTVLELLTPKAIRGWLFVSLMISTVSYLFFQAS